jgi:hypothetical protein
VVLLAHELVVAFGHVMPFLHVAPFENNIVVNQKPENKIFHPIFIASDIL